MIGPGRGHNIEPFLDFFQRQERWSLTFLSLGAFEFDRQRYDRIAVHELAGPSSLLMLFRVLRRPYRVIWYHGAYHTWLSVAVFLLKGRDAFVNLNIWSEKLPRALGDAGVRPFVDRWIVSSSDEVQCNWYGTEEILKRRLPEARTVVSPWGLHEDFLRDPDGEPDEFVASFIRRLPCGRTRFFYPKSFSPASGHTLLLEAADRLVVEGNDDFVMYWWLGNIHDSEALDRNSRLVEARGLDLHIRIVADKPFLSLTDYRRVWDSMDCGLQIAMMDQLSTTFIEPMLLSKPLIATRIPPYLIFEEIHNLNLDLVMPDADEIHRAMRRVLDGEKPSSSELERRRTAVQTSFDFGKNLGSRLDHLERVTAPS